MVLFASDLERKDVVASDGKVLGRAKTLVTDEMSGVITHLVVEPFDEIDVRAFTTDEEGNLIFPFDKVQSVKDVIVVLTV